MNTSTEEVLRSAEYFEIPIEPSLADKFLIIITRPDLPNEVSTRWLALQLGRPWRRIGWKVLGSEKVLRVLKEQGWRYRPDVGCKARSAFVRAKHAGRLATGGDNVNCH